jgi:hypothetical protein
MSDTTISIPVDTLTAARYVAAPDRQRQKIQLLVRVLLSTTTPLDLTRLQRIMDAMSDEAQANGLTPEILDAILRDDE